MRTELVKTSRMLKDAVSTVRSHVDAVDRAREIYLAQMKRAESEYFERIKRATATYIGAVDETSEAASQTLTTQAATPTN